MIFRWRPTRSEDRRAGEDQGSLVMASLFIVISVGMATLLASVVIAQIRSTRDQVQRVRALHAAQAGLDTVLAQIRAADDGDGNGVNAALPCGPISAGVGGGTPEQFSVNVYYVGADPRTRMTSDESWFAAAPNHLSCTSGSGPTVIPQWAVLYSTGTDGVSTRVLRGAYRVRTANQTILGGQIHMFYTASSTRDLCMDAVDMATVTAGTKLKMMDCDTTAPSGADLRLHDRIDAAAGQLGDRGASTRPVRGRRPHSARAGRLCGVPTVPVTGTHASPVADERRPIRRRGVEHHH